MQKYWVFMLFMTVGFQSEAQLPAGATAPDFTATDLNGQSWNLYDLLDDGKIVVLEISATWCAPCWAYHNGHAMHNFYQQHGPDGDDKARVLFVEGDPKTNINCLYGAAGCNSYSPGNWVDGTPFPIIDNSEIAEAYQVSYFPSIFIICPNRKLYEVGQWNSADLWEQAQTCPVAKGADNAGIYDYRTGTPLHDVCGTVRLKPSFSLVNLGTNALTQATLAMKWNDKTVQTIEWTGHLDLFENDSVTFDAYPINNPGKMTTTLTRVNNLTTDDDWSNNERVDSFSIAPEFNSLKVLLKIRTDQFGAETYWELRDEDGFVLESGGNQDVGPDGGGKFPGGITDGPGAYKSNTTIRDTLNLPGPGCYSIHVTDAYGDGMCCQFGNGYFKLYNLDNPLAPIISGGDFRKSDDRGFSAGMATATQEADVAEPSLRLYPNPTGSQINAYLSLPVESTVYAGVVDARGQLVLVLSDELLQAGDHRLSQDVSGLPAGFYILQVRVGNRHLLRKFVIQH